ncbi:hypothetical protein [Alkalicoccus chagannorensis]|uniref:hypothetical protein n=1 Tax=Alkalicoccus chagannorensis TaxID=427072 RepID=UPI000429119A|nr:hypothetical protein [Alkalicoccus chagannorensis]
MKPILTGLIRDIQRHPDQPEPKQKLIDHMEPKIRASLTQVPPEEREDLYQELIVWLLDAAMHYPLDTNTGFFEQRHRDRRHTAGTWRPER